MTLKTHLKVGLVLGVTSYIISRQWPIALGFFAGSVFIDFDHVWQYWRMNNFSRPLSVRNFFKFNDGLTEKFFGGATWLHLLFMHTLEFLLLLFFLAKNLGEYPLLKSGLQSALAAIILHILLDDAELIRRSGWGFLKRAHSVIEFFVRRVFFREKTYQELT